MAYVTEDWSKAEWQTGQFANREFLVSGVTTADQALSAVGIFKGTPYYLDLQLIAEDPYVSSPKGPLTFVVRIKYSAQTLAGFDANSFPPPKWRMIQVKSDVDVDRDRLGNAITNSSLDPFKNPVKRRYTDLVYEYRRYEVAYNIGLGIDYADCVNADAFTLPGYGTIQPGQGILDAYIPEEDVDRNSKAVRCLYRISIRRDGWRTRILDIGERAWQKTSNGDQPLKIVLKDGTSAGAVRLNGKGHVYDTDTYKYGPGAAATNNTTPSNNDYMNIEQAKNAIFLRYELYDPKPFAALQLTK